MQLLCYHAAEVRVASASPCCAQVRLLPSNPSHGVGLSVHPIAFLIMTIEAHRFCRAAEAPSSRPRMLSCRHLEEVVGRQAVALMMECQVAAAAFDHSMSSIVGSLLTFLIIAFTGSRPSFIVAYAQISLDVAGGATQEPSFPHILPFADIKPVLRKAGIAGLLSSPLFPAARQ